MRKIEAELANIRGTNNDPIQVCGMPFYVYNTAWKDGRITFKSTAHPTFLAENMSQVLIILKGLKKKAENPIYKSYAEDPTGEIWEQMSPYT